MESKVSKGGVPPPLPPLRQVRALRLDEEFATLREEILARIEKVCREGRFILGEEVETFERSFARWLGTPHAVACASGSDALLLSLMALGIGTGDEVITTDFSFFATAGSIVRAGARPVFVDIDPAFYTIDPGKIEAKITKKTKAIIPVHLYGQPCKMDRLLALGEKYSVAIIEDCAQAHGTRFGDAKVGTFGDLACFSFFPTKNLGCYGDGGAVVTRSEVLAREIRELRVHGAVKKYHHRRVGINSRLDELQAAVLNVKLLVLDEILEKRRGKASLYTRLLERKSLPLETPQEEARGYHTYHQYVLRTARRQLVTPRQADRLAPPVGQAPGGRSLSWHRAAGAARDRRGALLEFLNRAGIEAGVYYPVPFHLEEAFRFLGPDPGDFPEAERASRETLALPLHPGLRDEDQEYVVEKIQEFFERGSL